MVQDQPCHQAGQHGLRGHRQILPRRSVYQGAGPFVSADGPFSPRANSVQGLQRRGAMFLACHNAVWELCERLIATNVNPDHLSTEAMCAELSNHLIPGVILTPGAVGTLVELETAGFAYAR